VIRVSAYTLVLLTALYLLGCDGAAGPDGADAPAVDHEAPELELVQPALGAVLTESILILEAAVFDTSENSDVVGITFYVNGSSEIGGDTATVKSAPYLFEWDMVAAGTPFGPVTVAASVEDTLGNTRYTAARVVTRLELVGTDTLTDRHSPGTMNDRVVPRLIFVGDDTVRVPQIGTRFDPYGPCKLNHIRLFPLQRASANYHEVANFWVGLSSTVDGFAPGEPLDSFYVEMDPHELDRWQEYDLDGLMSESARTFADGESFFVTIRADVAEPDSMDAGLRIGTLLEPDSTLSPEQENAYWYERPPEGSGWRPISTRHAQGFVHHLFVDAVIEYLPEGE
jgi:hypothetical protein